MPQTMRSAYSLRITLDARYSCAKSYLNPTPSTLEYMSHYEYFHTSPDEDRHFPKELQLTPSDAEQFVLPDVVGMSTSEFFVNEAVRGFIEQIEGDKTDFTPIGVRIEGRVSDSTTFFMLRTRITLPFERGGGSVKIERGGGSVKIFHASDVASANLWRGGGTYYCSSHFKDSTTALGLGKGWEFWDNVAVV
jgi:hypothetical protein